MTSIHIKCVFFLRLISNWYFFLCCLIRARGEKWANEVWILSQRTTLYSTLEPLTRSAQTRNSSLWSETDFFFGKFPWVNKVFIIIVRTRGNLTPVNFSSFLFGVFQCGEETSCCRRRVYINTRWMSDIRQAGWRRFFSIFFCDKTHRLSREDAKPDRHTNQNQYRESDDN